MKLHLDKIETMVEEQLLIAAEELLLAHIAPVVEVEKNLWVAKFENHEVEAKTYGRKISSSTCECDAFFKSKICRHTVAAFLTIRKQKPLPVSKIKKTKKKIETVKKLNVSTILNQVKDEELVRFLALYARKDQQFTNFLKTKFATRIELPSARDKYANLLATIIRSNQSSNLSFSRSGAKKIHDSLNILIEEVEDEFRGENYLEVFAACRGIIEKVTPVLSRLTAHRGDMMSMLEKTYLMIINVLKEPIAPSLKTSISTFFTAVIRQRYFNYSKLDKLAMTMFKSLIVNKVDEQLLLECLLEETEKRYHNRELEAKIFQYYFLIIEKQQNREELLSAIIVNRPWLLLNSIELSKKMGHNFLVKWLTDFGINHKKYQSIQPELNEIRLQMAIATEEKEEIALFAAKRLLTTLNAKYFHHFKKQFAPDATEIKSLFERIIHLKDSPKKVNLLAELYLIEKKFEDFFQLIKNDGNLELLTKFAQPLYQQNKLRTKEITWTFVKEYLESHIGEPSIKGVQKIIRNLYKAEANDLAVWVTNKVRADYKSRKSLLGELIMFR